MLEYGTLLAGATEPSAVPLVSTPRAVVSVLMLVFGAFLLRGGFTYWKTSRLIRNTPRERVQSMAAGRTELRGEARPAGDVLDQPFGDGEAVAAKWEIDAWFEDEDGGGEFVTTARGTLATPFLLDDGTGRVRIEATDDAEIHVSEEHTSSFVVDEDEVEPRSVQEFLVEHRDEDLDPTDEDDGLDDRHRFHQEVLPPGEDVYVFGTATVREGAEGGDGADGGAADGGTQRLRVEADEDTGRFVISDMEEGAISTGLGKRVPVVMILGLVLVIVGFRLALIELGVG